MLSKEEIKTGKSFLLEPSDDYISLIRYEKTYKMNSVEAYYSSENSREFISWKNLFSKFIYANRDYYKINSQSKINYIVIPRDYFVTGINYFLKRFVLYIKINPNSMLLLTNSVNHYKKIIELCNEYKILCLLLTNNSEDKYLDYSNLFVQVCDNPKENAIRLKPITIK